MTFVCTTEYDATMPNVEVATPVRPVRNGLGEYLSNLGLTQLRIAENGEVCPCDLLLQRRRGDRFPRGGPVPHPVPEGRYL